MTETIDIPQRVRAVLALDPDARALQFDGRWRPWRYHAAAVEQLDEILLGHGIRAGAAVGVVMRNRPEIVRTVIALLATGRCIVTLSALVPKAALGAEIERLALKAIIACGADTDDPHVRSASDACGAALLVATDHDEHIYEHVLAPTPRTSGNCPGGPDDPGDPATDGVAVQMLTSGTTGTPKRVPLLYASIGAEMASVRHYAGSAGGGPEGGGAGVDDPPEMRLSSGVAIVWSPLLHISGVRATIQATLEGRAIALLERFDVKAWADIVAEHHPKAISLVPTALRMVYDADLPRSTFDGVKACFVGTSPLDPAMADAFLARYGVPVLVVYGATEFAGGVTGWTLRDWERYGDTKRGSVGKANAGIELRIIDPETDTVVSPGALGLLEVRGPQLPGGHWVRTTDQGVLDDDGFLWLRGRADDVVIRGGLKVSTDAVRAALNEHPGVSDSCVIGLDDERLGQVPVAALEPVAGSTPPTSAELEAFLRERLSAYQIPARFLAVGSLPRTPSMKISQPAVRALFETPAAPGPESAEPGARPQGG